MGKYGGVISDFQLVIGGLRGFRQNKCGMERSFGAFRGYENQAMWTFYSVIVQKVISQSLGVESIDSFILSNDVLGE